MRKNTYNTPKCAVIPVPLVLTRDQVRQIRGLLSELMEHAGEAFDAGMAGETLDILNEAETLATVQNARAHTPRVVWEA